MTEGPRIRAVAATTAVESTSWQADLEELLYLRDLYAPFGVPLHEEELRSGGGTSHWELARTALDEAPATAKEAQDADLVVVASGLPDLHPFTPVGPYVQRRLGSPGPGFTVSDQGSTAPFTALRIASAYQCAGRARKTVVVIVEQQTHPEYDLARDGARDGCVLLVLDQDEGPYAAGEARVEEVSRVRADGRERGTGLLADAVSRHTAHIEPGGALVVLGPHVPHDLPVPDTAAVHRVDRTGYGTGVWLELAERHAEWATAYRRIVLCETDARRPGHGDILSLAGGAARTR
jgi:hypothetical protein